MTDIIVCVCLMAFGFVVLGCAWIAIDGIAAFKTWRKHFGYRGRHTRSYREYVKHSPSMIQKEAEEIGALYFMAAVHAEREFLETRE